MAYTKVVLSPDGGSSYFLPRLIGIAKTKELMALAIGIAIHCDGCVAFHTKMAHQQGATREEVAETVALALYMGGGPEAVYGGDALRAYDQFTSTKT